MKKMFEKYGLKFNEKFYEKEKIYIDLLLNYSKTHNITALKHEKDVWENIFDSVYVLKFMEFKNFKVCDVGSGAGFPAIHLALLCESCEFFLYEPIAKKSSFLHLLKAKLGLKNVTIKTNRIENEKNLTYDLITSRAVSDTKLLLKLCENVANEKTKYLFYKGSSVEKEIENLHNCTLHKRDERNYLVMEKKC